MAGELAENQALLRRYIPSRRSHQKKLNLGKGESLWNWIPRRSDRTKMRRGCRVNVRSSHTRTEQDMECIMMSKITNVTEGEGGQASL